MKFSFIIKLKKNIIIIIVIEKFFINKLYKLLLLYILRNSKVEFLKK